jgi:hypothetical protein
MFWSLGVFVRARSPAQLLLVGLEIVGQRLRLCKPLMVCCVLCGGAVCLERRMELWSAFGTRLRGGRNSATVLSFGVWLAGRHKRSAGASYKLADISTVDD